MPNKIGNAYSTDLKKLAPCQKDYCDMFLCQTDACLRDLCSKDVCMTDYCVAKNCDGFDCGRNLCGKNYRTEPITVAFKDLDISTFTKKSNTYTAVDDDSEDEEDKED